jgi:hypothetical protein
MTSSTNWTQRGKGLFPALLAALLTLSGPGCASLQLLNVKTDKIPMADAAHPAIEILAIWQAAEGPGIGGIPTRGFAGQIFFFSQDRATPVAVDGKVRIYVFDDHGTVQQQAKPLHQYDFDRDSWTAHVQSSKVGTTYGVFIPYPRADYHQAVCSLRIRFSPPNGRPLYSKPSTIVLPGPPLKSEIETAQASPLNNLAKKLQSQSQAARPWKNPSTETEPRPLYGDSQMGATQPSAVGTAGYSTAPATQGARVNPIVQTSGGMGPAMAPASTGPQSEATGGYPVGSAEVRPPDAPDAVMSTGRIRLQAAPGQADLSSETEGMGSANDGQPADPQGGTPVYRPNHPLSD